MDWRLNVRTATRAQLNLAAELNLAAALHLRSDEFSHNQHGIHNILWQYELWLSSGAELRADHHPLRRRR